MEKFILLFAVTAVCFTVGTDGQSDVIEQLPDAMVQPEPVNPINYQAYCNVYCDKQGYMRQGFLCEGTTDRVYCCGGLNSRYCCTRLQDRVINQPRDVSTCPRSNSWWNTNWKAVLGLLGALVTVLMITTACYFCCIFFVAKNGRSRTISRISNRCTSIDSDYNITDRTQSFSFDPESPNAFTPPSYELSKNPPTYFELTGVQKGYCNMALALSESNENINNTMSPLSSPLDDMPQNYDIFPTIGEPPPPYSPTGGVDLFVVPLPRRFSDPSTDHVQLNGERDRRRSAGPDDIEASGQPLTVARRRSTTCITTSDHWSSQLPPLY